MRILVIVPVGTDSRNTARKAICEKYAPPGTLVDTVSLPFGPLSLETRREHSEVVPLVIETAMKLHKNYDALIVGCFLDPGVQELRKLIKDKVVVGPGEASLTLAKFIGEPIALITVGKHRETIDMMEEYVTALGLKNSVTIRGIPYGVLDIDRDRVTALKLLKDESIKAERDGSKVIVIGCTALSGLSDEIEKHVKIPVIDPLKASVTLVEALLRFRKPLGNPNSKSFT
ncbi:MAG: aspartate/glutamate racemase family protein [Zestosphaera sp.]